MKEAAHWLTSPNQKPLIENNFIDENKQGGFQRVRGSYEYVLDVLHVVTEIQSRCIKCFSLSR